VRSLVSNSIYAKKDRNGPPSANQVGVVTVTYLLSMAEITSGSSFEPNKPTEQKLGYVYEL